MKTFHVFLFVTLHLWLRTTSAATLVCNADNCLRALIRHSSQAVPFCTEYLGQGSITVTAIPSYVSTFPASRVSSGCSCLPSTLAKLHATTSTTTTTSTSKTTTSTTPSTTLSTTPSTTKTSTSTSTSTTSTTPSTTKTSTSTSTSTTTSTTPSTTTTTPTTTSTTTTTTTPTATSTSTTTTTTTTTPTTTTTSTTTTTTTTTTTSTTTTTTTPTTTSTTATTTSLTASTITSTTSSVSGFTIPSGVTYNIISSPTSCYSLPTPTASLTAVQVNNTGSSNIAPYIAYFDNGVPSGEFLFDSNGTEIIYDFTNPNQIGLTFPNGNTAVINATGIYLFAADCSVALAISSTVGIGGAPPSKARRRSDIYYYRRDPTPFEVDLTIVNQCGNPDANFAPTVYSGANPCSLDNLGDGEYTNACTFPDVAAMQQTCNSNVASFLNTLNGAIGDITALASIALSITLLSGVVSGAGIAAGLAAIAGFLNAPLVIIAIGVVSALSLAITHIGADNIASGICSAFYYGYGVVVSVDSSEGFYNLEFIESAPATPISTVLTLSDSATSCTTSTASASASATSGPCVGGTCGTYTQCGPSDSDCFCGLDPNGNSYCVLNDQCTNLSGCNVNSDCGGGYICLVNNCCGYSVCIDASACGSFSRFMERDGGIANGTQFTSGIWIDGVLVPGNETRKA